MKKNLLFGVLFVIASWAFTACESLGTCKVCRQVTYVSGAVVQEGPETEYCDSKLAAIQATPDYVNGTTTISWECR
ncbi:MAG: hypothetical protein WCE64_15440 [Bacteroidales bacterium]